MNHHAVKAAVVLTLLTATAGTLWAFSKRGNEKSIELSGTIEARDVEIGSLVGGRVARVFVEEGSVVAAGDPIVALETRLLDPQIAEQQGQVAEARAKHALLVHGARSEDVARARYEWQNAERERERVERLLAGGAVSQQAYDDLATRASSLREVLRAMENGSRKEDVAAAAAQVAREEARLAYLLQQRDETIVRAPGAGVVQTLDLRPGDLTVAGASVARLLDPRDQWVRGYVPEPLIGRVRVGQKAWATVDSWPDHKFEGVVTEVRTKAEYTPRNVQTLSQRADQVFAVKVALEPAQGLRPGMAAIVSLALDTALVTGDAK